MVRRLVGLFQLIELAATLALVWIGVHAPAAAAYLFAAAGLVAAWALIADGPLGVAKWVSARGHRRGMFVVAATIAGAPITAGKTTDLFVMIPCAATALVLVRLGAMRWTVPDAEAEQPPPVQAEKPAGDERHVPLMRLLGRATVVAASEQGPRAAGKIVGRMKARPKS